MIHSPQVANGDGVSEDVALFFRGRLRFDIDALYLDTHPGRSQVQLLGRYWLITNGHGRETEVQGEGVVGEQPHIPAGGEYQYTSGAVIETPLGTMQGHYEMIDIDGAPFRIEIPVFRLAVPTLIH